MKYRLMIATALGLGHDRTRRGRSNRRRATDGESPRAPPVGPIYAGRSVAEAPALADRAAAEHPAASATSDCAADDRISGGRDEPHDEPCAQPQSTGRREDRGALSRKSGQAAPFENGTDRPILREVG